MPEESEQQPERLPTPVADADLSALRAAVARLEGRFEEFREAVLQRIDGLERRIDGLERRIDGLDGKFNWLIGLVFASWVTLIGAIVGLYLKR